MLEDFLHAQEGVLLAQGEILLLRAQEEDLLAEDEDLLLAQEEENLLLTQKDVHAKEKHRLPKKKKIFFFLRRDHNAVTCGTGAASGDLAASIMEEF